MKTPKAAKAVPSAVRAPSVAVSCGDPVRKLFYDRVGRYFYDPASDVTVEGVCAQCGAATVGFPNASTKTPDCVPRRSITKERRRAAVGEPLSMDSPLHPTSVKNKMAGTGGAVLIEVDTGRSYVMANVVPVAPLPPGMTAVPVVPGSTSVFLQEFLRLMPKPPFLVVLWGKKASVPLVLTETLSRVFVCGQESPAVVDMFAVQAAVGLVERMGVEAFKEACSIRSAYGKARTDKDVHAVVAKLTALGRDDVTAATLGSFPNPNSEEYRLALHASGLQGTDTDRVSAGDEIDVAA